LIPEAKGVERRVVIAIDGPAGAGKSTIARRVAARLGFTYIDTGAMYRAVALWALRQKLNPADMHRMEQLARAAAIELDAGNRVFLNTEEITEAIRTPEVSQAASKVAVIPGVRRAMVEKQREMGARTSVVMEGRDIGTVVFPNADVKNFPRRQRRRARPPPPPWSEAKGERVNAEAVAGQMRERDERDRTRAEAPLTQAPDAVYLDSTGLGIEEVEEAVLRLVRARITNGKDFS
jgi:cytidylate kinase